MRDFVGPYRVVDHVGRGGMGVVYRGVHEQLHRDVAIKVLAPELTLEKHFKERFFLEARTQARLHHTNIVTVYDLLETDGEYSIVMEWIEGKPLEAVMRGHERTGVDLDTAFNWFSQILTALDWAQSEGVIHRDVKPSNVIVSRRNQVKLTDFGIAILVGDRRLTRSAHLIGTPLYMSPEQVLRPLEIDHRADIYSAGVLFFELITGRPPFDADSEYEIKKQHIEVAPELLATLVTDVPAAWSGAVARALEKDPEDRFSSAGEFLRALSGERSSDLRAASPSLSDEQPPAPAAPRGAHPLRSKSIGTLWRSSTPLQAGLVGIFSFCLAVFVLLFSYPNIKAPREESLNLSQTHDSGIPRDGEALSVQTPAEPGRNLSAEVEQESDSGDGAAEGSRFARPSETDEPLLVELGNQEHDVLDDRTGREEPGGTESAGQESSTQQRDHDEPPFLENPPIVAASSPVETLPAIADGVSPRHDRFLDNLADVRTGKRRSTDPIGFNAIAVAALREEIISEAALVSSFLGSAKEQLQIFRLAVACSSNGGDVRPS